MLILAAERRNRSDFYRSIGRSPPPSEGIGLTAVVLCFLDLINEYKAFSLNKDSDVSNKSIANSAPPVDPNYHRDDEYVHVRLEPGSHSLKPLSLKYLRISSKATVTHLRKYIALKVLGDVSRFKEVSIVISM